MQNQAWKRTCDFCNRSYDMNSRDIPRIYISKRIDLSDIESKDMIASPDYCSLCILQVIRFLERRTKLSYSVNANRIIQSISKELNNVQ